MGAIFSKPSMPTVTTPTTSDAEVDAEAEEARRRKVVAEQDSRGRASTLLTGSTGDTAAASTAKKTLLGG